MDTSANSITGELLMISTLQQQSTKTDHREETTPLLDFLFFLTSMLKGRTSSFSFPAWLDLTLRVVQLKHVHRSRDTADS